MELVSRLRRYKWLGALLLWGAALIGFGLIQFTPYGINESAARALLLNWSVAENIVNPIVVFGAPDLRALLFIPLGAYWAGSMVAVKVFTALVAFGAVFAMYRWARKHGGEEVALIGSGLTLVSPALIAQINQVGVAPFLLIAFGLALSLDRRYRHSQRQLAGWYFAQIFLILFAVSLHPMGLAYPLALAWGWWHNPVDQRHKKQMLWGIALATLFVIAFRFGWPALEWGNNPLTSLGAAVFYTSPDVLMRTEWWVGLVPLGLLLWVAAADRRHLASDFFAQMLLLAILVGLVAADLAWATVAIAYILYRGTHQLIRANEALGQSSFAGSRGIVFATLFIVATTFMVTDKAYRGALLRGAMAPQDEIIAALAGELADVKDAQLIGSQWPAKTMLATKHPAFPLPPSTSDESEFLEDTRQLDYLVFNPYAIENKLITEHVSEMPDIYETLIVEREGVAIKIAVPEEKTGSPASEEPEQQTLGNTQP